MKADAAGPGGTVDQHHDLALGLVESGPGDVLAKAFRQQNPHPGVQFTRFAGTGNEP